MSATLTMPAKAPEPTLAVCQLAQDALRFWSLIARLRLCIEYGKPNEGDVAMRAIAAEILNPTLPEPFATRLFDRWPILSADFATFLQEHLS